MTTDIYINDNKTETFKKGDTVIMHTCFESEHPENKAKVWTCQTDSFLDRSNQEVVFLENFSGYFLARFLKPINPEPVSEVTTKFQDLDPKRQNIVILVHAAALKTKQMKILEQIFNVVNPSVVFGNFDGQEFCRVAAESADVMKVATRNYLK